MNSIVTFVKSIPLSGVFGVPDDPKILEFAQKASMPYVAESNASVTVCVAAPSVPVNSISVALTRVRLNDPV
jgi:hypothetical protein